MMVKKVVETDMIIAGSDFTILSVKRKIIVLSSDLKKVNYCIIKMSGSLRVVGVTLGNDRKCQDRSSYL